MKEYAPLEKPMTEDDIARLGIYTLKVKLAPYDEVTKQRFMAEQIWTDLEFRDFVKGKLKEYGLKAEYISSGWEAKRTPV